MVGYDLVTGWGSPNTGLFGRAHRVRGHLRLLALGNGRLHRAGHERSPPPSPARPSADTTPTITTRRFRPALRASPSATAPIPSGPPAAQPSPSSPAQPPLPGTTNVTVTGTGSDATVETTTVSLTVTAAPSNFTIGASPTSLSITRGSSGTSTITTAVTQGSISSITLSASGQKSGTSTSFSPSSISGGNGSSTLKFTVSSRATTGTYTITVKGTGG